MTSVPGFTPGGFPDREPNAMDLEALLTNPPPGLAATVERLLATGEGDDYRAAAAAVFQAVEKAHGDRARVAIAPVAAWMRLGGLDAALKWSQGRAKTCVHAPAFGSRQPVWACAWKPGLVVCTKCVAMLKAVGAAAYTCDGCGHQCAGDAAGDPIVTPMVWLDLLCYEAGACTDCAASIHDFEDD